MRLLISSNAVAVCVALSTGVAHAQDVSGGVKAGLNFATVSNADQVFVPAPQVIGGSIESPRFIGGVFVTVRFNSLLAIQPEALYSRQGVKGVTAGVVGVESKANIDLIQIPVLLRVGRARGAYALAGPAFGFVSRATVQTAGRADIDIKPVLKSSDPSIVVGGGVAISRLIVEARYSVGLSDINKTAGSVVNKSQVFSILAGIQF